MHRVSRRDLIRIGASATAVLPFVAARAEAWPARTIKIIVSTPPGGITDAFARVYGDFISTKLGQPVIVENKPGSSGIVAAQHVKTAAPDGYTLLYTISSTLLGSRIVFKSLPYDADKDFALVSITPSGHLPVIANTSTGATNLQSFVEYARKNKTSAGSYGAGSFAHIVAARLKQDFDLDMAIVQYRGEAPMWQDFLAGSIQLATGSYQAAIPALETGKGRAIGVPTTLRVKKLPDVPTFLEQGYQAKVFQLTTWTALLGPAAMPSEIVERLSALMVEAGSSERVRKTLDIFGIDDAAIDVATFRKIYSNDGPVWLDAVQQLGLTPT